MNTMYLFNRALANGSLSREQEKAIFAKSGGGGFWSKARKAVSEMGRYPDPATYLDKLESEQRGRDAFVSGALSLTPVGAGVAIGDMVHGKTPGEVALASLGALPFAGGMGDDAARLARQRGMAKELAEHIQAQRLTGSEAAELARQKWGLGTHESWDVANWAGTLEARAADDVADNLWAHSAPLGGGPDPYADAVRAARDRVAGRLRAERAASPASSTVAESPGRYAPAVQSRRDELAQMLRSDRERKRWDLHPETFSQTPAERRLMEASRRNPDAPASSLGYLSSKTVGQLAADQAREAAAYQKAKAAATAHAATRGQPLPPGETPALYGNRAIASLIANAGPLSDQQRKAIFAKSSGGGVRVGRVLGGVDQRGVGPGQIVANPSPATKAFLEKTRGQAGSMTREGFYPRSGGFIPNPSFPQSEPSHGRVTPQPGMSLTPPPGHMYPAVMPPAGTHYEYDPNGGRRAVPDRSDPVIHPMPVPREPGRIALDPREWDGTFSGRNQRVTAARPVPQPGHMPVGGPAPVQGGIWAKYQPKTAGRN